ncbi:hypothetical protein cypCar_00044795, partial [Cyprinus carpio]
LRCIRTTPWIVLGLQVGHGEAESEITKGSTRLDDIKNMLGRSCDGIGFLKYLCRMLVNKYMGTLIEELSLLMMPRPSVFMLVFVKGL